MGGRDRQKDMEGEERLIDSKYGCLQLNIPKQTSSLHPAIYLELV